jgi:cell filamentation protein
MRDSEEFLDPNLDPETGIFRNLVGARTRKSLDDTEGSLSFARLVQLMDRPPKPTGDLAELSAIHRYLFQDLYDWAGQVRTVDIRKNLEGAEFFLPSGMIERASAFAAGKRHADDNLRGLDRERFIDRLAYHYDQVNYIHPFREGKSSREAERQRMAFIKPEPT